MSTTIFKSKAASALKPSRQPLSEAIAAKQQADQTFASLQATLAFDGAASKLVRQADAEHEAAEATFTKVQQELADSLVSGHKPTMTLAEARTQIEAATLAVNDAEAARATLRARVKGAETACDQSKAKVEACAVAVLRYHWAPRINQYLADLDAMHQQVAERGQTLARLISLGVISGSGPNAPQGIIELTSRYFDAPIASWPMSRRPMKSQIDLDETFAALKVNPNAKLPEN